jgi:hypothetical protein
MFSLTNFEKLPGVMLMSVINTQLRDHFASIDELAKYHDISAEELNRHLAVDGYYYNAELNQFKLRG